MQVPTVTEMRQRPRRDTATRVGWRLTGEDAEPLSSDTMLLEDADGVPAAGAHASLALWLRDPAGARSWSARGVDEIGGLASALELVGEDGEHRAFAVGPVHPFTGSAGRAARLWVGDELRDSEELLADHAETVRTAQRRLEALGEVLRPGDFLLAEAPVRVPVAPGDSVRVEIDGLDRLAVEIA